MLAVLLIVILHMYILLFCIKRLFMLHQLTSLLECIAPADSTSFKIPIDSMAGLSYRVSQYFDQQHLQYKSRFRSMHDVGRLLLNSFTVLLTLRFRHV